MKSSNQDALDTECQWREAIVIAEKIAFITPIMLPNVRDFYCKQILYFPFKEVN